MDLNDPFWMNDPFMDLKVEAKAVDDPFMEA